MDPAGGFGMRTLLILFAVLFAFASHGQNQRVQSLQASAGVTTAVLRATSASTLAGGASAAGLTNATSPFTNSTISYFGGYGVAYTLWTNVGPVYVLGGMTASGGGYTNSSHIRSTAWTENNVSTNTGHGQFASTVGIVGVLSLTTSASFPDNVRQTFNPGADAAGFNVGSLSGDPGTPFNGDAWYNTANNTFNARINGANVALGAGGGGNQTPILQNVNYAEFGPTNIGQLHLSSGAITVTPTNLTGNIPDLLMNRHSVITFTPTNTAIINVVTPTGLNWVWPPKIVSIVVTGATPALTHALTFSNATAVNILGLVPGTNYFGVFYDGITNRVFAHQDLTSGSGAYALTNGPTINNANLTGSALAPTQAVGDNDDSIATTAFVNGSILSSNANYVTLALNETITGVKTIGTLSVATNVTATVSNRVSLGTATSTFSNGFFGQVTLRLSGTTAAPAAGGVSLIESNGIVFSLKSNGDMKDLEIDTGGATAFNDFGDATGNGTVTLGGTVHQWTSTYDAGSDPILVIDQLDADRANTVRILELRDADQNDPQAVYLRMTGDSLATGTVDYEWNQVGSFSRLPYTNASTALIAGNAGFGGNVTAAGAFIGAYDAATAGSTLKLKGYLQIQGFNLLNGATVPNTNDVTAATFMQVVFDDAADQAANYLERHIQVPDDWDITVDPRIKLTFRLTAADTGTHRYVISMLDVAASAAYTGTMGDAINVDFGGDASGAQNDVEQVGFTTLTGWGAAASPGRHWVIRIARDGNATEDASTVDSMLIGAVIEYAISQ